MSPAGETPHEAIAQYILECRGKGAFLSYEEYDVVNEWVQIYPDTDQLLLTINSVLEKDSKITLEEAARKNLKFYKKQVANLLQQLRSSRI